MKGKKMKWNEWKGRVERKCGMERREWKSGMEEWNKWIMMEEAPGKKHPDGARRETRNEKTRKSHRTASTRHPALHTT